MTMSAAQIAEAAGCPTAAFTPQAGRLSTLFDWFGDADRLCVIARNSAMKPQDCDVGFSHALGHLGDRDLSVAFPEAGARAVAERLPFLEVPGRAFVLSDRDVELLPPLRPADVIASYRGVRGGSHDLTRSSRSWNRCVAGFLRSLISYRTTGSRIGRGNTWVARC
jgi:hypothetical protein